MTINYFFISDDVEASIILTGRQCSNCQKRGGGRPKSWYLSARGG